MIEFFGYWRSSAAYRCRIALGLKQIDYVYHSVHLRRNGGEQKLPDYMKVNPQGLVPAIVVDGKVLTQSLAIIEWLDETYPEPSLLPADPVQRANVRAFAQAIACDIHPLQNLRVLQYLKNTYDCDQTALDQWCQKWIGDGLRACEGLLPGRPDDLAWCFGDAPSLADICLAPQLYSAQRFGVDLASTPRLLALERRYAEHPAFAAAHPDAQPDKED